MTFAESVEAFSNKKHSTLAESLRLLTATQQSDFLSQHEVELVQCDPTRPLPTDLIVEMKMHLFPWNLLPNRLVAELMREYSWNEILFPFFLNWVRHGGGPAGMRLTE